MEVSVFVIRSSRPTASPVVAHFLSARGSHPSSQPGGGMRMRDGGTEQSGGEKPRWEKGGGEKKKKKKKKNPSMCRSRVARGHFTLMAAGPIEMTAALHDLKVRRQRIIFQWWRRGIGGVKWCLSTTPPLLAPPLHPPHTHPPSPQPPPR